MEQTQLVNLGLVIQTLAQDWKNVFLVIFVHRRITILLVLLFCIAYFVACSKQATKMVNGIQDSNEFVNKLEDKVNRDEIDINNVLVNKVLFENINSSIIVERTSENISDNIKSDLEVVKRELKPLSTDDLFDSFRKNNITSMQIQIDAKIDNITFIAEEQLKQYRKTGDVWGKLRKEYNSKVVLVKLSNIGFNTDRTFALVYMGDQKGEKSGTGNYYLLKKEDGKWNIERTINVWLS